MIRVPDFVNLTKGDREKQDWGEFKHKVGEIEDFGYYLICSNNLPIGMIKFVRKSGKFNCTLEKDPKYFPIPDGDYKCSEGSVEIGIYNTPNRGGQCGVRFNAGNGIHFIVDSKAVFFTAKFKITGNGKENFKDVIMTIDGEKCLPSWTVKKEKEYYTFVFVPTIGSAYVLGRGSSKLETRRLHVEVFGKTWKVHKNIMVVIVNGVGIRKIFGNDQNLHDNGIVNLENKELYTRMYIDQLIN